MRDAVLAPSDPVPEQRIWKGRTSQLLNFPYLFIAALTVVVSLPLLEDLGGLPVQSIWVQWLPWIEAVVHTSWVVMGVFVLWRSLVLFCQVYELTTRRLFARSGVLNRRREETEAFRILDLTVSKPFWLRLFGRGHVHLHTSDRSHPEVHLVAVADPEEVAERIRRAVMLERTRLGTRIAEID